MKKNVIIFTFLLTGIVFCQSSITVNKLSTFPEDYINKEISFKDIWWYPTLASYKNDIDGKTYYQVMLQISASNEEKHFGMGGMDKIMGVVNKNIAMELTNDNKNGYVYNYLGDVFGKVIKTKTFGSEYFFVIKKIIHHSPEGIIIKTYNSK
ncbi:MAG: hypothetical protein KKF62_14865 [Bacteroidetes bacterium]|nr:hypothetical protein [Bacteroidota bacterium]MBU1113976.1 hypothetical protein [Bacteroidota bacterium]MBU1800270.1 hypothetical protein [Bacteroidota bacterium]